MKQNKRGMSETVKSDLSVIFTHHSSKYCKDNNKTSTPPYIMYLFSILDKNKYYTQFLEDVQNLSDEVIKKNKRDELTLVSNVMESLQKYSKGSTLEDIIPRFYRHTNTSGYRNTDNVDQRNVLFESKTKVKA